MVDLRQLGKRQITNPCASVDQDVVIDKHRRGPHVPPTYASTAPENSDFHM
jgi:hypothetical protein